MAESDLILEQNTMKVEAQDFTPWQPDDQSRVRERREEMVAGTSRLIPPASAGGSEPSN